MKRALQVIGTLHIGGAENVAMNMFRYVDRSKCQMDYLVYDNVQSPYTKEVQELGGKIIRNNVLKDKFSTEKQLRKIIAEYGPYDIVQSHLMFHNGLVLKAAAVEKVPIRISLAHSTSDGHNNNIIRCIYRKRMRQYINNYCTSMLACGILSGKYLYGEKEFLTHGQVFHNRIDGNNYIYNVKKRNEIRKKLGFEQKKILLMVGHLIELKNYPFAFEVIKNLHQIDQNYNLYILGDGELGSTLKKYVTVNNMHNYVTFTGNVQNVNEYMIASDFLIMPSFYEGFPMTLIEAQAAGLRCVVSDTIDHTVDFTNRELIRFLPLDLGAREWCEEIKGTIDYSHISRNKELVKNDYDIRNMSEQLNKLYKLD